MNKNKIVIVIIVLIVLLSGLFLLQQRKSSNGQSNSTTTNAQLSSVPDSPASSQAVYTTETTNQANIVVTSPKPNESVTLPITIKGRARVFENQFNYRVRDVNKAVILEGTAYAQSPNAGQFGDYTIQINSLPTMRANGIVLEVFDYSAKDGQEKDTVSLPLVFDPSHTMPIQVYFANKSSSSCTTMSATERHIVTTQAPARAAIEELLKGPMVIEKNRGYYTNINDGVKLQKLTISNGVAQVDFNKTLEENVAGSCKVAAIRAQITQTLKQFPTVKDVVISIDGKTESILQP